MQSPFNVDLSTLGKILAGNLSELAPGDDVVKFRKLLFLPLVVRPGAVGA